MDLGTRLFGWLQALGMTQQELARRSKRSRAAICYYVNGDKSPSQKALASIVIDGFGISMARFYGRIPRPRKRAAA